jgi:hypothetical protein
MSTTATKTPLRGNRLLAVVAGGMTLLLSAVSAIGATGLTWATSKQDDAGYYMTATERVAAPTRAIATDDLDVNGIPGEFGKIRVNVRAADGKPLFAGIARTADVDAYLAGSDHTILQDVDFDPFEPNYVHEPGTAAPARPADQRFWVATSDGTKPLDFKVRDGEWSVVVMNADGSPDVRARVSAGASLPWLDDLELAAWIAAAFLLVLGGALLAGGLRPPTPRSWPDGSASAA